MRLQRKEKRVPGTMTQKTYDNFIYPNHSSCRIGGLSYGSNAQPHLYRAERIQKYIHTKRVRNNRRMFNIGRLYIVARE